MGDGNAMVLKRVRSGTETKTLTWGALVVLLE